MTQGRERGEDENPPQLKASDMSERDSEVLKCTGTGLHTHPLNTNAIHGKPMELFTIRLPTVAIAELKRHAISKYSTPRTLARQWLQERLEIEERATEKAKNQRNRLGRLP